MRFNDGAVDSRGRYWAGAMNDPKVHEPTDEGVLFRLDPDLKLHRMIEKVTIPNGMGWSADDKRMFFTDTPTKNIFQFDYDAATGEISNRRVFFHCESEEGPLTVLRWMSRAVSGPLFMGPARFSECHLKGKSLGRSLFRRGVAHVLDSLERTCLLRAQWRRSRASTLSPRSMEGIYSKFTLE